MGRRETQWYQRFASKMANIGTNIFKTMEEMEANQGKIHTDSKEIFRRGGIKKASNHKGLLALMMADR